MGASPSGLGSRVRVLAPSLRLWSAHPAEDGAAAGRRCQAPSRAPWAPEVTELSSTASSCPAEDAGLSLHCSDVRVVSKLLFFHPNPGTAPLQAGWCWESHVLAFSACCICAGEPGPLPTLLTSRVPFLNLCVFLWHNEGRSKDRLSWPAQRGRTGGALTSLVHPWPAGLDQSGDRVAPAFGPKPRPPRRPGAAHAGVRGRGCVLGGREVEGLAVAPGHREWALCVLGAPGPLQGREPRSHNKTPLLGSHLNESLLR